MDAVRTPNDRFNGIPDWPYEARYVNIGDDLRVHYVDEGTGPVVLLLHGEPTWGYLYRKMIPGLVEAGCRVLVPDLVGFGKSDKPTSRDDYTYGRHLRWLSQTIEEIDAISPLPPITMFCQDWGGLLGLCHVAQHPAMYRGVVASNTGVPLGRDIHMSEDDPFAIWRRFSQNLHPFKASECVASDTSPLPSAPGFHLSEEEKRAYDAPFVDEAFAAGAGQCPLLVPTSAVLPSAPLCRDIWSHLSKCEVPIATSFGDNDPVTGPLQGLLSAAIPGAANQPHTIINEAGHFIQEHQPEKCVDAILALLDRTG